MLFSLFNVAMHAKKYASIHRPRLCYDTEHVLVVQQAGIEFRYKKIVLLPYNIGDKYGDVLEGI